VQEYPYWLFDSILNLPPKDSGIARDQEVKSYVAEPSPLLNVCLLCKRQFNTPEALKKHENISELHKRKLEIEKAKPKQKKEKHFKQTKEEEEAEDATTEPVNVGAQLLQKMGWKEGDGIGRNCVVTAPIEVELRADRAGLGLLPSGEGYAVHAGDKYAEAVKKRARARFDMIEDEDENKYPKL